MRTAVIETATGKVVNVVELEPEADWQPPQDHHVQDARDSESGDTWDGVKYVKPPVLAPLPPTAEQQAWANATPAEKLSLVAKRLGFERQ